MIKITASDIVGIISPIYNKYLYIYIYISVQQEFIEIQTTTLWIYHVHPTRKKRTNNRLNLTSQKQSLWFESTGPLPILRTEYIIQRVSESFFSFYIDYPS